MIGLRHHYFTLPWNLFDLALVSASVVGLIMEDVLNEFPISPTLLRVVRVFRLGRVLRLVKVSRLKKLNQPISLLTRGLVDHVSPPPPSVFLVGAPTF